MLILTTSQTSLGKTAHFKSKATRQMNVDNRAPTVESLIFESHPYPRPSGHTEDQVLGV
jgi:hypothetical protein